MPRRGDECPWATRALPGHPGRLRAFVQTVSIVLTLNRRHLRRWGRLSLAESRRSSSFALVVGLWVCINAVAAFELFGAGAGKVGSATAITFVLTHLILLPVPLAMVTGAALIQAGVLSKVARRLSRSFRVRSDPMSEFDGFQPPDARDESLTCPECDYNLAGLPSDVCPECGLDGAVTLARRGFAVEGDPNVWAIVAYGTACWVPGLVLLDLLALVAVLTGIGHSPEAAVMVIQAGRWVVGVTLVGGSAWWVVFQVVALERSMGRPLYAGHNLAVLAALVLSIGLTAWLMLAYLRAIRSLAGAS